MPDLVNRVYSILITGVGGTGVVTIGAILGMAAHLEGLGCGIIDMAGLAQKGGAVISHIKLAPRPEDISTIRVGAGAADLVLGCDHRRRGIRKVLRRPSRGDNALIVNTHEVMPGDFTRNADYCCRSRLMNGVPSRRARGQGAESPIDATRLATALMGNSIAANLFMLGYAWQKGRIPSDRRSASNEAIEINGVAVEHEPAGLPLGPARRP